MTDISKTPALDALDAMTITMVMVEAFSSIDWSHVPQVHARGAVLLYDQVMRRIKPLLPDTPEMAPLFRSLADMERLAAAIRAAAGAAPVV